jgi:hypothetical protein
MERYDSQYAQHGPRQNIGLPPIDFNSPTGDSLSDDSFSDMSTAQTVDRASGGTSSDYNSTPRRKQLSAFEHAFVQARKAGHETFSYGEKKFTTRRGDEDVETWRKRMVDQRTQGEKQNEQIVSRAAVATKRSIDITVPKDPIGFQFDSSRRPIVDTPAVALNTNYQGTDDEMERNAIGNAGLGYVQAHGAVTGLLGGVQQIGAAMGSRAAGMGRIATSGAGVGARRSTMDLLQQANLSKGLQFDEMVRLAPQSVGRGL